VEGLKWTILQLRNPSVERCRANVACHCSG